MGVHAAFIHLDSQVQASLKRRPRRLRTGCPARGGERITGVGGDAGAMEQGQGTQGGIPAGAEETGSVLHRTSRHPPNTRCEGRALGSDPGQVGDFLGGPGVKTPHSQCRGFRFNPWPGN